MSSPARARPALERAQFAARHFCLPNGAPWRARGYQQASLESWAARKVHCDGRDVGKTSEIEIIAAWAMCTRPNTQMLVATQCENHLFPLMHRLSRRFQSDPHFSSSLREARQSPSWFFRFDNGFALWGRLAGPRGMNFQGMHVDWQIVDEAQEMAESSWGELFQALNGGGRRWVYGVPNGRRDTFYRMTQDPEAEQYHWPSTLNPDFSAAKEAELARLYGGRDSPGYLNRVLGLHGAPARAVFSLEDYHACVASGLPFHDLTLCAGDVFTPPSRVAPGDYCLGCDLGYARDPSEFAVYLDAPPHLQQVLRVRLEGVNYAMQQEVIEALDAAYAFAAIGIDAGNNGRAVAHQLMTLGPAWCAKVHAFEFGARIDLPPLPDGRIPRRRTKEFMTELLQRRMAARALLWPPLPEREQQYAAHTYSTGRNGEIVYSKGNDHLIDADRCAVLAHWLHNREPETRPDLGIGFASF